MTAASTKTNGSGHTPSHPINAAPGRAGVWRPRQVAVLILRDVLGFHADEVANMRGSTVGSVHSALKRARAGLKRRLPSDRGGSRAENVIVAEFVRAWEAADLDALLALLTDDVLVSMPPMPFEYEGLDAAAGFFAGILRSGRKFDLVPTAPTPSRRSAPASPRPTAPATAAA